MKSSNFRNALGGPFPRLWAIIGACAFILLATAGLRVLTSCATTPAGIAREEQLYRVTTNAVGGIASIAPYTAPPVSTLLEGITAVGGALLAVWASHLHRSVRALESKPPNGASASTPGAGPQPKV